MIVYFTFQETPSSFIFKTQVTDVINYLRTEFQQEICLLSIIPAKNFFYNKKLIKMNYKGNSYVIPQIPIPKMFAWKINILFVFGFILLCRPKIVICRNIFASWMMLKTKTILAGAKVVFDNRGLVSEEAREYNVYPKHVTYNKLKRIEDYCVNHADQMMVITEEMVEYYIKY